MRKSHIRIEVELDADECELVHKIGPMRYEACRKAASGYTPYNDEPPMGREINSFGAEVAVAKFLGVAPDRTTEVRQGGPDVYWNGLKIDVKRTTHNVGRLFVKLNKTIKDADIYILVTGKMPVYTLIAWCFAYEIINEKNIVDSKFGRVYALSQNNLHSLKGKL